MMEREVRKPAVKILLSIVPIGLVMTVLAVVSMRMAYHRAYVEVATTCDRIGLVVVGQSQYFCAPVARVEMATRGKDDFTTEDHTPFGDRTPGTGTSL